jgi:hypothetical protein
MATFFKKMFSQEGSVSLMRVLTFLVVIDIMSVWTAACLKDWKVDDLPWGIVTIFGIMITGKAVQKFAEPSTATPTIP